MTLHSIINRLLMRDPWMQPNVCYGQDGEDLVLDRLLEHQAKGFYVDVGAHHPVRFSNTYLFYRRGWNGINIDAMPGSMKLFKRIRPRDTNIECGVASQAGVLTYHRFNEPALNTFDPEEARIKDKAPYSCIEQIPVSVERLDTLLERHLPNNTKIDFLSVDVEGLDEQVLRSNDWKRYRPKFILAETLRVDLLDIARCPVAEFLLEQGYVPVAKTYNTTIFVEDKKA